MYAHQVIDDIKKWDSYYISEYDYPLAFQQMKFAMKLLPDIANAQKFHFENSYGVQSAITGGKSGLYWRDIYHGELRLPFPLCWFDHRTKIMADNDIGEPKSISKKGLLVKELENNDWDIMPFAYVDELQRWYPPDHWITVHPTTFNWDNKIMSFAAKRMNDQALRDVTEDCQHDASLVICALLLIGCKNIGTEIIVPPDKLNAKRKRVGRTELFSYHTLVIKPTGKKQESIPKHLWNNRIHICRGHFKEYTEDRKLFGKYTGRYWWQPSVRGRNKDGVVMKDYVIESPQSFSSESHGQGESHGGEC